MKVREGFVSNSSSSSFVLPKEGMSEEQINKIEGFIDMMEKDGDDDYIYRSDKYFHGSSKNYNVEKLKDYLGDIDLDPEIMEVMGE